MGLRANIYTTNYNASNGGISEKFTDILIVDGIDDPDYDKPNAVELITRFIGGERVLTFQPINGLHKDTTGWMAGGAYIGSSDSRFRKLAGFYGAVPLHDRQETWAEYDRLSR